MVQKAVQVIQITVSKQIINNLQFLIIWYNYYDELYSTLSFNVLPNYLTIIAYI